MAILQLKITKKLLIVNHSSMHRITRSASEGSEIVCKTLNLKIRKVKLPQCAGLSELLTESQHDLHTHPRHYRRSYHSGGLSVVDLEVTHGFNDGHYGLDGVAVDHGSVLLTLVF